jgi:hypothetical protein
MSRPDVLGSSHVRPGFAVCLGRIRPDVHGSSQVRPSGKTLKIKGRPNVLRNTCFFSRARAQAREYNPFYIGRIGTLGRNGGAAHV